MRRTLSYLKLCFLCCAFAHGVGQTRAVQSALPRPPDAASADDGRMGNEPPLRLSETPAAFSAEAIQKTANEARLPTQSNPFDRGIATGLDCALTREAEERYTAPDGKTWLVDSTLLEEIGNDLQEIVNCTKEGDVLSFNTTAFVRPSSRVTVPWQLTFMTHVDSGIHSSPTTKTRLKCPHKNSGLFLVESMNVTLVDLVIEACTFDGTDGAQSIIEIASCRTQNTSGLVALYRVIFRKNTLIAASGLRMSSSSCSELEMVEVEISENVCSGEACGVHLGKKNRLENCVAFGNIMAEANGQQSSILFGAAASDTTIQGLTVRENKLGGVTIQDGSLTMSNASFEGNTLDTRIAEEINSHCLHLVNSSAQIEACIFVANEGYRGTGIFAKESRISVSGSIFNDNVGAENGGCVYVEESNAEFKHTKATANKAEKHGGFVYAASSTVKLDDTDAANNSATYGGCVRARESDVMLERTYATANTAEYGGFMSSLRSTVKLKDTEAANNFATWGGFVRSQESNVTFERTNSVANRAEYGGFMSVLSSTAKLNGTKAESNSAKEAGFMNAQKSNVTFEHTIATANSAQEYGGFVLALNSTVKLDDTDAVDNSARWGGFLLAKESNVTLKGTNSTANGAESGGLVLALNSVAKLDDTNAIANSARDYGGFMLALNSTVKLDDTNADSNRAKQGGFADARESDVTFKRTIATANNARKHGGFMFALSSTVKLNDMNASRNSAKKGGFTKAQESNVALKRTIATANSAREQGGFMFVSSSTVTLDNTNATSNGAKQGGFVRAQKSKVTLKRTIATANNAQEHGGFMFASGSTVRMWDTNATGSDAQENGGFVYAASSTVKLDDTNAASNGAKQGGFMNARGSIVVLEHTIAIANKAQEHGGFMFASGSTVRMGDTNATGSNAQECGGFVYAFSTSVKLDDTNAASNSANQGGFMNAQESNVALKRTIAAANNAQEDGGFMFAVNSIVELEKTDAATNSAQENGGFLSAQNSMVKFDDTNLIDNSATECGGFLRVENSTVTMERTTTVNDSSKYGGFVWARNSTLNIAQSQFHHSSSKINGGFASAFQNSSIFIVDSTVKQAKSKNGGAIRLKKSHLVSRNFSILHCEADESGGGVYGFASSTVLCLDCKLHNNSAKGGNGGAVFFDAQSERNLALQLVQSRIENNVARMGGGVFFFCEGKKEKCLANGTDCPFMALTETQFSRNEASIAGGAVFTGYLEAIRFRCANAPSDVGLRFYEKKEWKGLRQVESDKDICSSWKGNRAEDYGHNVATYATTAQVTIENANKSICSSGGENCVIEGYRSGEDLSTATVKLFDGLRQNPARNYRTVHANMSSQEGQFLLGSIVRPMEYGSCIFQSIRGFVPPGEYNLTVEFDRVAIENIGITVRVHNCFVGQSVSSAGFCENCSSTTYNFHLSANFCLPCPENGNCESQAITPDDGYWQKTPCSNHLRRCLPTSACEVKDRSRNLTNMVRDVSSCVFEEEWIEDYTQAQCAEGHEGPLCGSCQEDFGHGMSSNCNRCLKGFFNVAYILMSATFLLVLTGITIHGTVSALRGDTEQTHDWRTPSSSELANESPRLGTEVTTDGVAASEKTLAKWKVVEMFKITLSFVQTTVLLASIDVGWAIPVIIMAAVAELLGGLASEGIRRSVVCLTSKHLSLHPTALALIVSVCVVPCAVLLCWTVFWAVKSPKSGSDGLQRYLSKRCLLSAMVVWYVTLVPVLKTALSVFLCVDVHDSADFAEVNVTHMYWAVDTGLRCYEGDHWKLLYGVVVAFVCPVYGGLLALFVVYLNSPPQHLSHKRGWAYQTTGFLYRSYRMDRRRYWEVAIVARKATIAFLVFCAHLFDNPLPITGIACIIMLAILAHIMAMPYREDFKDLNRMELASLFVSVATSLAASMLKEESYPEDSTRVLLTVACALLNIIVFCVFVFYILKFAAEYLEHVLMERDEHVAPDADMFRVLAHWISYKVKYLIGKMCPRSGYAEIAEA